MAEPVISVSGLSKRYILGHLTQDTLRDQLSHRFQQWVAQLKGQKSLGRGEEEFWALKDINFEVHRGEVVGVIGRNGAGKSTLLKILSRITEPSSGKIRLRGRLASLLEVGTGFHPELTGRDNIYLNGAILGMGKTEIRKKFDEIVAFAEVEQFLDTPVKRYSSGMYVRLAFAVAAHLEPEILIVDEVLAVGDQEFQKRCLGKMQEVSRQEGRTVLFVSHNLGAIQLLCTKALVLQKGGLLGYGEVPGMVKLYTGSFGAKPEAAKEATKPTSVQITSVTSELQDSRLGLSIQCLVQCTERTKAELEFHLTDLRGDPVAFSSTWIPMERPTKVFEPGLTRTNWSLDVSMLANGDYRLKVQLLAPMEKVYDTTEYPEVLQIFRNPLKGKSHSLIQEWNVGNIELPLKPLA